MTYEGDPETFGYPQTMMMLDIQAIQYLYGANFDHNSGDTTYTWNQTTGTMSIDGTPQRTPGNNRIFMTLWDGNGIDTYNLSNYTTNLSVNLAPGEWSTFNPAQLARIDGNPVRGNVANALLFQGDTRSLIENAIGGAGNDTLLGNDIDNYLNGNIGNDSIVGGLGNDAIAGGEGNDTLDGGNDNDALDGGNGNDRIVGGTGNDAIAGGSGNDTISAGLGNDTVDGGIGSDLLNGEDGNDVIAGGDGNDTINPGLGNDTAYGGNGNDSFNYTYNNTTRYSGYISGGSGEDILTANFSNFSHPDFTNNLGIYNGYYGGTIYTRGGSWILGLNSFEKFNLTGTAFNDVLYGLSADDTLNGGLGNDTIDGQAGNDSITGGDGNDSLSGGTGIDRFILADETRQYHDDGNNTTPGINDYARITDFNPAEDKIQLRNSANNYLLQENANNTSIYINKPEGEPDELIAILNNVSGLNLNSPAFIYAQDSTPRVTLGITNNPISENGNLKLTYTFTRTGNLSQTQTVNFTVGGTATLGSDYTVAGAATFTATTGSINFAQDSNTAILTITPKKDTIPEPDETVTIAIDGDPVTGTILNDDSTTGDDRLVGTAGNDSLDGKAGNDTMEGLGGNDTYIVDSIGDVIIEQLNAGSDTVRSTVNRTLDNNVEILILTGTATEGTGNSLNNSITGNAEANTLTGNAGNDTLNGGASADNLIGGDGNDSYTIDSADTITEDSTGGTDTVSTPSNYTLGANLERLTLTGTASVDGIGNELNNSITGNAGNNNLRGENGNDTLTGGAGNDILIGGLGNDSLIGGTGSDNFVFNSWNERIDTVRDFVVADDTIVLPSDGLTPGQLAASMFTTGSRAATAEHRIIYNNTNGALFFDADGSGNTAAIQFATLSRGLALDNNDFLVG